MENELDLEKKIELKHCPCSLEYITKWNVFLIGTYELSTEAGDFINKRHGSLALIQDEKLILEQNCTNGGVFNFFVFDEKDFTFIYTAHSNGKLSLFKLYKEKSLKLEEVLTIETESNMLTCLDVLYSKTKQFSELIALGDSCSTVFIVENEKISNKIKLIDIDYPIWTIKLINFNSNIKIMLIGSDDCKLRCLISENKFKNFLKLFTLDCFEGGIISIEIRDEETFFKVFIGSYDEKIRILKINKNLINLKTQIKSENIEIMKILSINGAGIWKIKNNFFNNIPCFYLIPGMYSGIHLIKNDSLFFSFNDFCSNKNESDENLIYDCCFNKNLDKLLIASFYKKTIFCFKIETNFINKLID